MFGDWMDDTKVPGRLHRRITITKNTAHRYTRVVVLSKGTNHIIGDARRNLSISLALCGTNDLHVARAKVEVFLPTLFDVLDRCSILLPAGTGARQWSGQLIRLAFA